MKYDNEHWLLYRSIEPTKANHNSQSNNERLISQQQKTTNNI